MQVLEVTDLIVCGHTRCGAIEAIIHPERAGHLPFVSRWLAESAHLPALIAERYAHLDEQARLVAAAEENVLLQLENLRTFDFVAERLRSGKLKMSGWLYEIAKGQVFNYDPDSEQFTLLASGEAEAP